MWTPEHLLLESFLKQRVEKPTFLYGDTAEKMLQEIQA